MVVTHEDGKDSDLGNFVDLPPMAIARTNATAGEHLGDADPAAMARVGVLSYFVLI